MCRLPPGPAMHPFLGPALIDETLNNTFPMLGNYIVCTDSASRLVCRRANHCNDEGASSQRPRWAFLPRKLLTTTQSQQDTTVVLLPECPTVSSIYLRRLRG